MFFSIYQAIAKDNTSIQGNSYSMISILIIFALILYFIILQPQIKRAKQHKKMIESIYQGDEILTTGGIIGKVTKITEPGYLVIALNSTIEIIIKRDFVSAILPKGTMKALNIIIR
ncbi:MAG: preprotein translocase subunit YajC [Candidatus Dasytiphilus stammeri]